MNWYKTKIKEISLSKLIQDEVKNLNNFICNKEMNPSTIKKLQTNMTPSPNGVSGEFC